MFSSASSDGFEHFLLYTTLEQAQGLAQIAERNFVAMSLLHFCMKDICTLLVSTLYIIERVFKITLFPSFYQDTGGSSHI